MTTNNEAHDLLEQQLKLWALEQRRLRHRKVSTTYWLWFFLGTFGVHQFYLGKTGRGVSMLLTFGWLWVGLLIDLFTIPSQVRDINAQIDAGER